MEQMTNSILAIGSIIALLNLTILVLLTFNVIKCYTTAVDIEKAPTRDEVNFYFLQMFGSMVFFVANAIALYTGALTYLIHKNTNFDSVIWWQIADRTGMLVTAVLLILIRTKFNPFTK